ncbi:MAG: hypothetical protein ACQESA_03335 [Patescibacteria group bacterium]
MAVKEEQLYAMDDPHLKKAGMEASYEAVTVKEIKDKEKEEKEE